MEMKKGWLIKTLGDVCDVINGGTPKTGLPEYWDGNHRWITPAEMGKRLSPYVNDTERKITDLGLRDSSARMLPPNSVILSSRAPIGHLVINTEPMGTNQGCKGLIPHSQIEHKFLYYYLSSIVDLLNSLGTGATFKELSGSKLKEVTVPVPPLAEQQRIVGLLDEAFEGLATAKDNAQKNLQNARALFESHLQSVFAQRGPGWVDTTLSQLCDIKHGFAFKGEFFTNKGDYVVLTPGNYFESGGYRDRGEKQKYYAGEIPPDYIMKEGEMLVAMTEQAAGLLGSPLLVPESDKFLHNQRLGLVTAKPGVPWTNEFFFHVFNTQFVRQAIHDSASGVKVRHTSPTKIGEVVVSFPTSIKEQKAIVAVLADLREETQRLARLYERKLAALEALKKSLLHQAFTGEL
jgi:type I restriction enzyme S subunit